MLDSLQEMDKVVRTDGEKKELAHLPSTWNQHLVDEPGYSTSTCYVPAFRLAPVSRNNYPFKHPRSPQR